MNWKELEWKQSWPEKGSKYIDICVTRLRKTTKSLDLDNQSFGRDINPGSEYEAGVLTTNIVFQHPVALRFH
jgi:hypothetical protein